MSDFYKLFKERLESDEQMPPPEAWENIEKELDESLRVKRLYKYSMTLRVAAACVLILFAVLQTTDSYHLKTGSKYISGNTIKKYSKSSNNKTAALTQDFKGDNTVTYSSQKTLGKLQSNKTNNNNEVQVNSNISSSQEKQSTLSNINSLSQNIFPAHLNVTAKSLKNNSTQQKLSSAFYAAANDSLHLQHDSSIKKQEDVTSSAGVANHLKIKKKLPSFSLTAFFSNDINFNNTEQGSDIDYGNESEIQEREANNFSFNVGMLAGYRFSKKWSLQSGLSFSTVNNNIAPCFAKGRDYDGTVKFVLPTTYGLAVIKNNNAGNPPRDGDSLHLFGNSSQKLNYLTVPVLLNYQWFSTKKIELTTSVGIGINFITSSKFSGSVLRNTNQVKQVTANIDGLRKDFYTGYIGMSAGYNVSKKIILYVEPLLRYSLTSFNKNVPVRNSLNSISLSGGIKIPL